MKAPALVLALLAAAAPALAMGPAVSMQFDRVTEPAISEEQGIAVPHNLGPLTADLAQRSEALEVPAVVLFTGDSFIVRERGGDQLAVPNFLNAGETRVDDTYLYPLAFGVWSADLDNDLFHALNLVDAASHEGGLSAARFDFDPPDLAFDLDLPGGDFNACAIECPGPDGLDALAAEVRGIAGFARGFGAAGGPLPVLVEELVAPAAEGALASPAPAAQAEPRPDAPLATLSAGPLPAGLTPDQAALLAAAAVALGALLAAPFALYSKIRRDMTLVNDTRRAVFEAVVQQPGLSIQEVARRAAISHSTAAYHLDRLAGAGLVVATGDGNKVRYYRNGGRFTEQERKLLPCLENAETVRVLETVLHRPWTYRAEVAQALGVTATTVNWHLKRLFGAGMLSEAREGRSAYLFVDRVALAQTCQGLHEKVPDSPAREAAARILAQLGPQVPPAAVPDRPRLPGPTLVQAVAASVALVPQAAGHPPAGHGADRLMP